MPLVHMVVGRIFDERGQFEPELLVKLFHELEAQNIRIGCTVISLEDRSTLLRLAHTQELMSFSEPALPRVVMLYGYPLHSSAFIPQGMAHILPAAALDPSMSVEVLPVRGWTDSHVHLPRRTIWDRLSAGETY